MTLARVRRLVGGSRYRREVAASSLATVVVYGLGLLSGPFLARALGPEGRGEVAAVIAPAFLIALLLPFGLPQAAAYFVDSVPASRLLATATAFGFAIGMPVCGGLWFLAPAYLANHSDATLIWARLIILALPLSVGIQTVLEIERRKSAGASWNRWRSAPQAVPAIVIVLLSAAGVLTFDTAMAAYAISSLIPLPLLIARLRNTGDRSPSFKTLRLMLPYAWRSALTWSGTSLTARLDQVVLAVIVTSGQLGMYAVAVTAASVTNPLTTGVSLALFGHLRGDPAGAEAMTRFRRSMAVAGGVSTVVAAATGILAPLLLRLAFGTDFQGAAAALRLLLPGAVAVSLLGVLGSKLSAEGRPGEMARAALVGAVVTVAGLLATVRPLGIRGAATITSMAYIVQVAYLLRRGAARAYRPDVTEIEPSGPQGSSVGPTLAPS